ncbi:hypothetical protein D7X88_09635 [bacterium C-53]|nr:hypothetical protein [Lachnospiraceae bacterium]NBI03296.1 hypothetical protein [Lachnospiraceae bacterium]RKJ09842.1 hypothetical protein D7X88_09635 [bacterium C-53]
MLAKCRVVVYNTLQTKASEEPGVIKPRFCSLRLFVYQKKRDADTWRRNSGKLRVETNHMFSELRQK